MTGYDHYSDAEYALHSCIAYADMGLISTANPARPSGMDGFLFDLFDSHGGEVGGEPGWSIERITPDSWRKRDYSFLQEAQRQAVQDRLAAGDAEVFYAGDMHPSGALAYIISSASFWRVVQDAFLGFVAEEPGRAAELARARHRCPPLQAALSGS